MPLEPLTARQASVLRFIVAHLTEHWRQPTLREIAAAFGMKANGAKGHVFPIQKKGWLVGSRGTGRTGYGRVPGCAVAIEGVEDTLAGVPIKTNVGGCQLAHV